MSLFIGIFSAIKSTIIFYNLPLINATNTAKPIIANIQCDTIPEP